MTLGDWACLVRRRLAPFSTSQPSATAPPILQSLAYGGLSSPHSLICLPPLQMASHKWAKDAPSSSKPISGGSWERKFQQEEVKEKKGVLWTEGDLRGV